MPINQQLVREISSTIRILKDTIEYHWLVGCVPTAVANVIGYWDRNGFDNLINGDSSFYSEDVKNAIASPEHYRDYYEEYQSLAPDASSATVLDAHENNSIADFLRASRAGEERKDGSTQTVMYGAGLHGYATYRGYDNFETAQRYWGKFTFQNIVDAIDSGAPLMLSVDTKGVGSSNHAVVVYGYDKETQELIVHDGWSRTNDLRRIDFQGLGVGNEWGIKAATFVKPPQPSETTNGKLQLLQIADDQEGSASSMRGLLSGDGRLQNTKTEKDSDLSRSKSLALASANGNVFYRLFDDGSGSARLSRAIANGDGTFVIRTLSDDSKLDRNTIALATADGQTFYSLSDDGEGSAALYKSTLNADGTFSSRLLNQDSGASRSKTLGLSTTDSKTFYRPYDDGAGSAAMYTLTLSDTGRFSFSLLNSDTGISRSTLDQAAWITPEIQAISSSTTEGVTKTGSDGKDSLEGTSYNDSLSSGAGNDELFGYGGNDVLIGGLGNDNLVAGGGDDVINPTSETGRGRFEQDYIDSGSGKDTILLGDENGSYYTADGWNDSVYIEGFAVGSDKLVLFGNADLYMLNGSAEGTYLLYGQDYSTSIAFLKGVSNFTLNQENISFVGEASSEPVTPAPETPVPETPAPETLPAEPTTYNTITGTVEDDSLLGTGGADRLVGLNGVDYVYGGGGTDQFVLGDANGSFYVQAQWADYAYIDDFTPGTDQLELHGSADDYSVQSNAEGTWLYAGDIGIEPIAYLKNISNLQLSSLNYV